METNQISLPLVDFCNMEKAITMDSHVIEILPIDKQSVEIPFLKPASMKIEAGSAKIKMSNVLFWIATCKKIYSKLFRMNLAQKQ